MTVEQRIQELGFELPATPKPVGAYAPVVRTGKLVFTSGQLPIRGGTLMFTGKVPSAVSLEQARQGAAQAALNALAAVKAAAGSLDQVVGIVRLNVYVNSAAGFFEQAKVANGASELLVQVFGEAGKHTRSAVGAAELPLNAPVELDLVVEVR